jgi:apolipoprotein N-acyltransferase
MARLRNVIPTGKNALLALLAAALMILSFPDFEYWFLAWFALVPLMWAIERQSHCVTACFTLGWVFGTTFFFGTAWWLTYAPIHYAGMPWPIAYLLIFIVCAITGLFPAIFTTLLSILIRRFGSRAFLAAPFVWVFTEFLRYWLTGNNWNAVGYSQAFTSSIVLAAAGGVWLASFFPILFASLLVAWLRNRRQYYLLVIAFFLFGPFVGVGIVVELLYGPGVSEPQFSTGSLVASVVALQPNIPMSGMDNIKADQLRNRQIDMAEGEMKKLPTTGGHLRTLVILPESPMNLAYTDDREFQQFIGDFARRNNVSVLFNSSEPDRTSTKYFNSAVMVGPDGRKVAEYDKIFLLPFGEAVPWPLEGIMPGFVGTFAYGSKYDLLPVGDAKAGVMICFESHFGELSRRYVQSGADVLIEMTNDGYLGPTPVLRQHLANAVFRAVETNRPVLRVTNVGITTYVTERGEVLDPAPTYQEATRVWSVSKSDGSQTFYVKYGDWFAWLCTIVTVVLLASTFRRRASASPEHSVE